MNFVLHFAFARAEGLSAPAAFGAMLPDLWRMADRRIRPRSLGVQDPEERRLMRGVEHHLEADRWFHDCEVFRDGEAHLREGLGRVGVPKLGRFGHIGWELCLDGAWLRRTGVERFRDEFRESIVLPGAARLGLRHRSAPATAAERQVYVARFERIIAALLEEPWLEGYLAGTTLALQVSRIRLRVGLAELTVDERDRAASVFEEALNRAPLELDALQDARGRFLERA
ncbi:MAG: hypothetical protein AAGA56_03290 [Myxococcota bacterium]